MTTLADVYDFLVRASQDDPDLFYQLISGLREFDVLSPWGKVRRSNDTWVREDANGRVMGTVFYDSSSGTWRWNVSQQGARPETGGAPTLDAAQAEADSRLGERRYILPTTALEYTPKHRPPNKRRGGPPLRQKDPNTQSGGGSSLQEAFKNAWEG